MKLATILLILCGFVAAQTRPADVEGWDVVKWGMTERQAVAASEGRFKPLAGTLKDRTFRDGVATYGMEVKVDVFNFQAHVLANPDGFVTEVLVLPSRASTEIQYQALLAGLMSKYGEPHVQDKNGSLTVARWTFPSTVIELSMLKTTISPMSVGITYRPNRPASGL